VATSSLPTYVAACSPTINQPGVYTTAWNSNCDYLMAPGNYIFMGGGVSLAGNSSLCTGSTCSTPTADGGVFMFFTNSSYPSTGGSCATVGLNGNNATTLTAPDSGTYKGMLMWQDSACTGTISVGGNGSITGTGSIYAPSATVSGNGNGSQVTLSQIVAQRVNTQNANFTMNYSYGDNYVGDVPALVE